MTDIFISYASGDRSRIAPLAEGLASFGWSVWWDRNIPAGKNFDDVIEKAINDARCIIVVWSEESVSSRWVRTEADEGVTREILVPVMLDNVTIPLAFKRIQAANLVGWRNNLSHAGFNQLVKDIASLIGPASAPQSPPRQSQRRPAPARKAPSPATQGVTSPSSEKKPKVGVIAKLFPFALLIIWVAGILGHVGGILIHLVLLLAVLFFLITIVRSLRR